MKDEMTTNPSCDFILKEDAIDLCTRFIEGESRGWVKHAIREVQTALLGLPQGWIPCSEGLPKTMGEYLVTVLSNPSKNPISSAAFYFTLEKEFGTFKSSGEWEKWDVVAWMPLPKPYKGGDSE